MARTLRSFLVVVPTMMTFPGACAGGPGASGVEEAAPRGAAAETGRAAQVLQIHDVRDLVDPQGDADRVADLAAEIRAMVTFLYADVDPDLWIGAKGSAVVVRGVPEIQFRVKRYLQSRREGIEPTGI